MRMPKHSRTAFCGFVAMALVTVLGACSSSSKSATGSTPSTVGSSGGSSSTTNAATGPTITVGVIASLTGSQASTSAEAGTVAPAWADWINANGGIDGHPVKVVVLDDQFSPAVAQADGQELISKGVVAVIPSSDYEVEAFDSAVLAKGIPIIAGSGVDPDWAKKVGMFPTALSTAYDFEAYVNVAKQFAHSKKMAYAYCAEIAICADGVPLERAAAQTAGIGFTSLAVSATSPSYVAQCLELEQQGVDAVNLAIAGGPATKFIQDCKSQGYAPNWVISGVSIVPAITSLTNAANVKIFGDSFAFPPAANLPSPAAEYTAAMQKYATNSNWMGGDGPATWDGLQVMAKAIEDVNVPSSTTVTSQDVLNGLYRFKSENLGGELANKLTYTQGQPVGPKFSSCYFAFELTGGQVTLPDGLTPQCLSSSGQG